MVNTVNIFINPRREYENIDSARQVVGAGSWRVQNAVIDTHMKYLRSADAPIMRKVTALSMPRVLHFHYECNNVIIHELHLRVSN